MRWAALLLLGVGLLAPPASSQLPAPNYLESFTVEEGSTQVDVPVGGKASVFLLFTDTSRDSAGSATPGGPGVLYHVTSVKAIPVAAKAGWQVQALPVSINSIGGQSQQVEIQFQVEPSASEQFYAADVNFTFTGSTGQSQYLQVRLLANSPGLAAYTAQVSESYLLKPKQIVEVPVRIRNTSLNPRFFDFEVVSNPCDMGVATSNGNLVLERSVEEYPISIRAPSTKIWYAYESCALTLEVRPQDNANQVRTVVVNVQVAGLYINPMWVFNTLAVILLLVLLLLLVARRKARIEEEILGKPQKPWTIPVEALYLDALRKKDARAWYVVRHYLMEDEYRSSLLWYKAYKKQTKGSRKKEALVLRQEKAYDAWKAAWAKDIEKPLRKADRFEAKLQKKLDRKADKAHRKQMRKYRAVVGQMEKAHGKQVERASEKYEKAAAKARKKGQPLPDKPVIPKPDYPEEPEPVPIALAEHKWAKKAARYRARRVREQGDLEVKFEKADARRLRKVRRKVQKMARKLDDPEFVAEHPLLQDS